jgi:hypothetical protein
MDVVEHVHRNSTGLMRGSARETWAQLIQINGLGSFLAGQACADVEQLPQGANWTDRFLFAPIGPGSARGINRLTGRPIGTSVSQADVDRFLPALITRVRPHIQDVEADKPLIAIDWQSSCCEIDKRLRLEANEGQVRARYDGAATASNQNLSLF